MWPWSGCSWLRPPWTPIEETWCWMLTLSGMKIRPWLLRPSKQRFCHAAIVKEAEAHQAIHTCTSEKSYKESMLELEYEVVAEEGWDCWAFLEACGAVLWVCPPKAHGELMYPLQLLTNNVPLATISRMPATILQLATAARELTSTAPPSTVSEMPAAPLEPNGGATHPTRKQPCKDQGMRKPWG